MNACGVGSCVQYEKNVSVSLENARISSFLRYCNAKIVLAATARLRFARQCPSEFNSRLVKYRVGGLRWIRARDIILAALNVTLAELLCGAAAANIIAPRKIQNRYTTAAADKRISYDVGTTASMYRDKLYVLVLVRFI